MKVIFLDVDGVLNDSSTKETCLSPDGYTGVDDEKLYRLARIVWSTGARVVLTSTWKEELDDKLNPLSNDGRYLLQKIAEYGLGLYDKTEDDVFDRGHGILKWLSNHHEVDTCIVLDDTCFDDYAEFGNGFVDLSDDRRVHLCFIKTNCEFGGLTDKIASRCIQYLNAHT